MKLSVLLILSFLVSMLTPKQLIPVEKNGKWGYCDQNKQLVINYLYETVTPFNAKGVAIVSKGGKYGIIGKDNQWKAKAKYANIKFTLEEDEMIVRNTKGKQGIINAEGDKILNLEYDSIKPFDHNHSYLAYKNNLCGLYNTKSKKWNLPLEYTAITFNEYGLLEAMDESSLGLINEKDYSLTSKGIVVNKTRGSKEFKSINFEQWEDLTVIITNNGYNIMNKEGKVQLAEHTDKIIKKIDSEYYNSNGFKLPHNAKYIAGDKVYVETSGQQIEEHQLDEYLVESKLDDEIKIKNVPHSKKYALYKEGKKVSYEYDSIKSFNDDFLQGITYKDNQKNVSLLPISEKNKLKILPVVDHFHSVINYISNGNDPTREWVILMNEKKQQGIFDLNTQKFVVPLKYEQLYIPFVESYGLALVGHTNDQFAFYDIHLQKQVTDMKYDANISQECIDEGYLFLERMGEGVESKRVMDIYDLNEKKLTGKKIDGYNIIKRKKKGTVHYSNNNSGWETNIDYELSEFAPENFASCYLQDQGDGQITIGFLDRNFNIIIPPKYATVEFSSLNNPYLKVTDFEFNEGIIDVNGKIIIPLGKYLSVGAMEDGIAPVEDLDGNKFFVNNKDERYIVNP
ncbi:WG repeat-containing protein [Flammeovirga sp. EKP202]|uniref:WG repeat-containing protein n=1 Tax=Flammeovirga sp. EKP202 TaxID=2770592 RepID=UPI00165FF53F|nr:WG repeat-containing protein [Flammeovirga sp. EKP202]MBD0402810.1 WG repeat-containing protein [Flammeovirga sp. EKP202]